MSVTIRSSEERLEEGEEESAEERMLSLELRRWSRIVGSVISGGAIKALLRGGVGSRARAAPGGGREGGNGRSLPQIAGIGNGMRPAGLSSRLAGKPQKPQPRETSQITRWHGSQRLETGHSD